MASKTRIPNKLIWGLKSMRDELLLAERAWAVIQDRLKTRCPDPVALMAMCDLRDNLANIMTRVQDARVGEFDESL